MVERIGGDVQSGEILTERERPTLLSLLGVRHPEDEVVVPMDSSDNGYDEVVGRNGWTDEDEIVEALVDYADAVNDASGLTDRGDFVLNLEQSREARAKLREAGFAHEKHSPSELNDLIYDRIKVPEPSTATPMVSGIEFIQPDTTTLQRLAVGLRNL